MPIDYSKYPSDWKEISERIRFDRAGNKCEWCGVENHALILRSTVDGSKFLYLRDDGIHYTPDGRPVRLSDLPDEFAESYTKVILTVAHLGVPHEDGTPGDKHDKHDVRPENLAALCQRCHLLYDMDDHIKNRKKTRLKNKRKAIRERGQLELWRD